METTPHLSHHSSAPETFRFPTPEPLPECHRCIRSAVVIMSGHLLCGDCFLQYTIRVEEGHQ